MLQQAVCDSPCQFRRYETTNKITMYPILLPRISTDNILFQRQDISCPSWHRHKYFISTHGGNQPLCHISRCQHGECPRFAAIKHARVDKIRTKQSHVYFMMAMTLLKTINEIVLNHNPHLTFNSVRRLSWKPIVANFDAL